MTEDKERRTRERKFMTPAPADSAVEGYPTDSSVLDIVTERRLI